MTQEPTTLILFGAFDFTDDYVAIHRIDNAMVVPIHAADNIANAVMEASLSYDYLIPAMYEKNIIWNPKDVPSTTNVPFPDSIHIKLFDVTLKNNEDESIRDGYIGWIDGGWDERLAGTTYDKGVDSYFDTIDEIEYVRNNLPYELNSDFTIESLDFENPVHCVLPT